VWCEETCVPSKQFKDVLGRPMKEQDAKQLVTDLEKSSNARPEEL